MPHAAELRTRAGLRVALSYYVANGLSAAFGLLLISICIQLALGDAAAAAASVGVIVCIPPDQPAPKRGKVWQLLPAALIGLPLFLAAQALHAAPIRLGLLLVPATFLAFLAAAWGKRGIPISVSIMFAMIFSMAVPDSARGLRLRRLYDQSAIQDAEVWVNGTNAGAWYSAATNTTKRWAESDFLIPASLVAGRSTLDIEIRVVSGTWSEYRYELWAAP